MYKPPRDLFKTVKCSEFNETAPLGCLQIKRQEAEMDYWTLDSIILIAVHFTAIELVMNYKKGQKRKFSLSILTRFILELISTSGPTPGTAAPKIWQQIQLQHVPGWLFSTVELMWGCINMLSWVSVESNYPELQWCFILFRWQWLQSVIGFQGQTLEDRHDWHRDVKRCQGEPATQPSAWNGATLLARRSWSLSLRNAREEQSRFICQ